jgi:hypothetical protein
LQFVARIRRRRVLGASILLSTALMAPATGLAGREWAPPAAPAQATSVPACTATTPCVTVDATHVLGPVDLVASGLLLGVDQSSDPALIDALRPASWRLAGDPENFAVARGTGATVTEMLSDQWPYANGGPSAPKPWDDWSAYAQWVRQTVTAKIASGELPDYWEVQNEPDGMRGTQPLETTAQALYQYQVASTVIRQVDPLAKIEGPSLLGYFDTPGQSTVDMTTFLAYVNAHHLPLDALSWHEVIGPTVEHDPNIVITHVRQARALLSQYPAYANIPIFINEYEPRNSHLIPGWEIAWINALESAGVAQAVTACWKEPETQGKVGSDCGGGGLDGMFQTDTGQPQALYWVHLAYAEMVGERVQASSTDPNISAYATYNAVSGSIQVLIGRHASCTPLVHPECTQPASATPGPEPVNLRVKLPWGWTAVEAFSQRIPNLRGPMSSPATVDNGLFLAPQISIPVSGPVGVTDGDAYAFTLLGQ